MLINNIVIVNKSINSENATDVVVKKTSSTLPLVIANELNDI